MMVALDLSAWLPGRSLKWRRSLSQLLEAASYAQNLACDAWRFAITFRDLRDAGLTTNDVAWLLAKGYLEREQGVSGYGDKPAGIRPGPDIANLSDSSRFILSQAGIGFATEICPPRSLPVESPSPPKSYDVSASQHTDAPHWDAERRKLWLGGTLVKHIKVPARNQELVLSTFEEECWPHSVDDPLPPSEGIDSKLRLHDTIVRLNRGHNQRLVRFHGNGDGRAIYWERV